MCVRMNARVCKIMLEHKTLNIKHIKEYTKMNGISPPLILTKIRLNNRHVCARVYECIRVFCARACVRVCVYAWMYVCK